MSIEDEVISLACRSRRPPRQPTMPSGLAASDIDAFQKRTGLYVPDELRHWLSVTNAPHIGVAWMLGIQTGQSQTDIEACYRSDGFPVWIDKRWIPIATDGFGNYYVLATRPEDGPGNPVFFVDCVADPSGATPTYVVASDLWHFLRFYLRAGAGETWWPFDRARVLADDPALEGCTTVRRPWESEDEQQQ